jgi:regulator of sirC expression with transglutaminase-like and TPR domain
MTFTLDDVFRSRSLAELLRHPLSHVEHAAIWIARDAHASLIPRDVLAQLDALAADFEVDAPEQLDPCEQASALVHHLAMRHGFAGNNQNYYEAENSYLDSVLRRRLGIPISLAVVYLALARRVAISAQPVGFPGHFLVRVGPADGLDDAAGHAGARRGAHASGSEVYVDPFEGRTLTPTDLTLLLGRALGPDSEMKAEYLAPASAAQVAQRMLLNLKRVHETQHDHARALLVCDRLVELAPSAELRRDRGLCALKLGANKVAVADLAHYLLKRPTAADAKEIRAALARSRKSSAPLN